MAGRAKENLPGGSLKYLLVYLNFVYLNVATVYIFFCVRVCPLLYLPKTVGLKTCIPPSCCRFNGFVYAMKRSPRRFQWDDFGKSSCWSLCGSWDVTAVRKDSLVCIHAAHIHIWLAVWNMNFIFPYIGNSHPNWLSYFSEGLKPPTRCIFVYIHVFTYVFKLLYHCLFYSCICDLLYFLLLEQLYIPVYGQTSKPPWQYLGKQHFVADVWVA